MFPGWQNNRNNNSGHSRAEHISSFLNDPTLKPSTRKTSKDDSTYEIVFQTKNSHTLLIHVHMPPQPPSSNSCSAPFMKLVGIEATHPWLNNTMQVVGYGPISSDAEFHRSTLLLSQIVVEIVQYFQLHPPQNVRILDSKLQRMQPKNNNQNHSSSSYGNSGSTSSTNNGTNRSGWRNPPPPPPPPPTTDIFEMHFSDIITIDNSDSKKIDSQMKQLSLPGPPVTESVPEVSSVTTKEEMILLLNDTKQLYPKLETNFLVSRMEDIKANIVSSNHITATSNISNRDNLHTLHQEVTTLQSTLKEKVEKVHALQKKQYELCKPMNKDIVLKKLKKAKKQSMKDSDDVADKFLVVGGEDVEAFIDEFLEKKIVHHVRAAKIERIENS